MRISDWSSDVCSSDLCPSHGIARNLVYAVMAEEAGQPLHVGDTYSEEAAREVVRRLRFETGFYGRAWEISSAHITEEAGRFLAEQIGRASCRERVCQYG